ncbi:MAG: pyrroline-5-carboxylate reductase family protein [Collinsella sp.]
MIACEKASTLTEADHDLVFALLDLLGTPVEVETRLLSVAGTVGGCSPAFIAMVIEALADAAVKHGIPRATAYPMVSQMMVGTAKLQLATGMHPGAMKDAVCSPAAPRSAAWRSSRRRACARLLSALSTRSRGRFLQDETRMKSC